MEIYEAGAALPVLPAIDKAGATGWHYSPQAHSAGYRVLSL